MFFPSKVQGQKHLFLKLPGIVYANLQLTTELLNVRFFASFRYFGGFRMMSKIAIDSHSRAKIAILMLSQTWFPRNYNKKYFSDANLNHSVVNWTLLELVKGRSYTQSDKNQVVNQNCVQNLPNRHPNSTATPLKTWAIVFIWFGTKNSDRIEEIVDAS